ncbi:MAG: protease modulator HflK [Pseudomonadota bacterium]
MNLFDMIKGRRTRKPSAGNSVLSEVSLALSPVLAIARSAGKRILLLKLGLISVYAVSGFTIIEADQVGVVMRFGEITRSSGQPVIHSPGILFAMPKPFDQVYKIEVDRVETIVLSELAPPSRMQLPSEQKERSEKGAIATTVFNEPSATIDPESQGYVLTGDRNIMHLHVTARYRISDPVRFTFYMSNPKETLRSALLESTIKTSGAAQLDDLLGTGRDRFASAVSEDAQFRLDRIGVGIEIVSMEFENLSPPEQVIASFDAVQSAYIEAQTQTQNAKAYAAETVPAAQAQAKQITDLAKASATAQVSTARSTHKSFMALLPSYSLHPKIVRDRIHRDMIENVFSKVGRISFVPPPVSDSYNGTRFRIELPRLGEETENVKATHRDPERLLNPNEEDSQSASIAVLSRGEPGGASQP